MIFLLSASLLLGSALSSCIDQGDKCPNKCKLYNDNCQKWFCNTKGVSTEKDGEEALQCRGFEWVKKGVCSLPTARCITEYTDEELGRGKTDDDEKDRFQVPEWIKRYWSLDAIKKLGDFDFDPTDLDAEALEDITQDQADNFCKLLNYETGNDFGNNVIDEMCKRFPICKYENDVCKSIAVGDTFKGVQQTMGDFMDSLDDLVKDGNGNWGIPGMEQVPDYLKDFMNNFGDMGSYFGCSVMTGQTSCMLSWAYCEWKDDKCMKKETDEVTKAMQWANDFASCETIPNEMVCNFNRGYCKWDNGKCATVKDWRDDLKNAGEEVKNAVNKGVQMACERITMDWMCLGLCEFKDGKCSMSQTMVDAGEKERGEGKSPLINDRTGFDCEKLDFFFCRTNPTKCMWNREKKNCSDKEGDDKEDNKCVCNRMWDPVCDDNGKKYPNSCMAECNGVKAVKECEGDEKVGMDKCFVKKDNKWSLAEENTCAKGDECGSGKAWRVISVNKCDCGCKDGKCNDCETKPRKLTFDDYKTLVEAAQDSENCKKLGAKYKKNKCTAPKSEKKVKCKKVDPEEVCESIGCTLKEKKGKKKCQGKPFQ